MSSTGVKILVIGLTALGLSAGVVAGMLVSRLPAAMSGAGQVPQPHPAIPTPLVEELGLSPSQQEQMRQIWEGVRTKVQDCFTRAQALQNQRDEEIIALLNDEQKAKFQTIAKRYHDLDVTISNEREQIFAHAIARTKQLLTKEQQEKYDRILKARLGRIPSTNPSASANVERFGRSPLAASRISNLDLMFDEYGNFSGDPLFDLAGGTHE